MSLSFRILGCGSSGGVPRIDGDWGACDPNNPKNKRSRCSLLVSREHNHEITNLLIDTSPDMREQLIAAQAKHIDGVLISHDHADQTHGIDDLRALVYRYRKRIPVWMDTATSQTVTSRFEYCFQEIKNSGYPSILEEKRIHENLEPICVEGAGGSIEAQPFYQEHGRIQSLGFRIGEVAYSSDISDLPKTSWPYFDGVKIWVVDALRYTPHPTHFHLEKTIEMVNKLNIEQAILTNLHIDLDYKTLCDDLPKNIRPAFDGMVF